MWTKKCHLVDCVNNSWTVGFQHVFRSNTACNRNLVWFPCWVANSVWWSSYKLDNKHSFRQKQPHMSKAWVHCTLVCSANIWVTLSHRLNGWLFTVSCPISCALSNTDEFDGESEETSGGCCLVTEDHLWDLISHCTAGSWNQSWVTSGQPSSSNILKLVYCLGFNLIVKIQLFVLFEPGMIIQQVISAKKKKNYVLTKNCVQHNLFLVELD